MLYGRDCVFAGKQIELTAVFLDEAGGILEPDEVPSLYIYTADIDTGVIQEDIANLDFVNAYAGPLTSEKVADGVYRYTYTVPTNASEGYWHDLWAPVFDGVTYADFNKFKVRPKMVLEGNQLQENQVVVINLSKDIAAANGKTLIEDTQVSFATQLYPFLTSLELVNATIGPWIEWMLPFTQALMIYNASKEIVHVTPVKICDQAFYDYACSQFIIYDIMYKAYMMPARAGTSVGVRKSLGDLSIGRENNATQSLASGIDPTTLAETKKGRDEWLRIAMSGGCLNPGQGVLPEFAVAGFNSADRNIPGRLWLDPSYYTYNTPMSNVKILPRGHYRTKGYYLETYPWSFKKNDRRW